MVSALTLTFMLIVGAAVLGFISVSAMFLIWWERKVSAHIQTRFGPMRVGWHGALQSIADAVKLLLKEDIRPAEVDILTWWLAPFFVVVPSVMAFVTIPFGRSIVPQDLNIGVLYIIAISSVCVIGIFMAGWGSNNKYSLLGGMRSAALIVSYEVPLILSMMIVAMHADSFSMQKIVAAQSSSWNIFHPDMALACIIYTIAATAEVNRAPFDLPEAESELVAGFHTEYSGMKFAMFFVSEYTNLFIVAAISVTLFFGGWNGPLLPPIVWFLVKTYALIFIWMWVRWTFPRIRIDQLMSFAWKVLTPAAIANLAITGWVLLK